jgi:hypothetical protein
MRLQNAGFQLNDRITLAVDRLRVWQPSVQSKVLIG